MRKYALIDLSARIDSSRSSRARIAGVTPSWP
jgi:hypothetical protein